MMFEPKVSLTQERTQATPNHKKSYAEPTMVYRRFGGGVWIGTAQLV